MLSRDWGTRSCHKLFNTSVSKIRAHKHQEIECSPAEAFSSPASIWTEVWIHYWIPLRCVQSAYIMAYFSRFQLRNLSATSTTSKETTPPHHVQFLFSLSNYQSGQPAKSKEKTGKRQTSATMIKQVIYAWWEWQCNFLGVQWLRCLFSLWTICYGSNHLTIQILFL